MKEDDEIRGGVKEWFIGTTVGLLIGLLSKTLSYEFIDEDGVLSEENNEAYIFTFWHNRILALGSGFRTLRPDLKTACLTSASKDGAMIEAAMNTLGISSIRGSSSRRGRRAMVEMIQFLRTGGSIAITPDGPRGPVYKLNPGVIRLASRAQKKIVLIRVHYSSPKELKTWDKFQIPKPFSKVTAYFHAPLEIPEELTPEEEEKQRLNLEETLLSALKYKTGEAYAEYRW